MRPPSSSPRSPYLWMRQQVRLRLTGPLNPEEWYLTIVYVLTHVGAIFLWFAKSPAMSDLLSWMYIPWMATFYVSSAVVLLGFCLRVRIVEALCLPLVASGLLSYALAVVTHPPYGNHELGLAAGSFLSIGLVSISWRFGHDIMGWGKHHVE